MVSRLIDVVHFRHDRGPVASIWLISYAGLFPIVGERSHGLHKPPISTAV